MQFDIYIFIILALVYISLEIMFFFYDLFSVSLTTQILVPFLSSVLFMFHQFFARLFQTSEFSATNAFRAEWSLFTFVHLAFLWNLLFSFYRIFHCLFYSKVSVTVNFFAWFWVHHSVLVNVIFFKWWFHCYSLFYRAYKMCLAYGSDLSVISPLFLIVWGNWL